MRRLAIYIKQAFRLAALAVLVPFCRWCFKNDPAKSKELENTLLSFRKAINDADVLLRNSADYDKESLEIKKRSIVQQFERDIDR